MSLFSGPGRVRALLRCLLAIAVFWFVQSLAARAADGFSGEGLPASLAFLLRNLFQLFLELIAFAALGLLLDKQQHPLRAMGLQRQGLSQVRALRQFALGAALGWGMVAALLLPVALAGRLYVHTWTTPRAFILCIVELATLLVASLANEVVFRGYPFQRLLQAAGPVASLLLACAFFGLLRKESIVAMPGASTAAVWVSVAAALLLSLAYLRTRALWLPWGLHFAWLASMGVLFGLPLAGEIDTATVIQSNAYGPHWLTGGDYGPESAWITFWVLLGGVWLLLRITQQIDWQVRQPDLRPAGIAVELTHNPPAPVPSPERTQPAAPSLIQISGAAPAAAPQLSPEPHLSPKEFHS